MVAFTSCGTRKKDNTYNVMNTLPPDTSKVGVEEPDEMITLADENRDTLDISLVMQFDLKENFSINTSGIFFDIYPSSLPAVNFYEGALLAMDSLSKLGLHINLTAFDSPGDSTMIRELERSDAWKNSDYVIVSASPEVNKAIAWRANDSRKQVLFTNVVDPELIKNNPNVAVSYASTITQCREMAKYIVDVTPNSPIHLVFRDLGKEKYLAKLFKDEIVSYGPERTIKEYNASGLLIEDLPFTLDITKTNFVIVVSSDEAFVSPVLTALNDTIITSTIKVAGLPTWQGFESIDFFAHEHLEVYLFENNYIEKSSDLAKIVTSKFVESYSTTPSSTGIDGFDLIFEIGSTYRETGIPTISELVRSGFKNRLEDYSFVQPDSSSGYENNRISVLHLKEYSMKKVND